jgi:anti-sigma regulatory factor (Ser/Thr protein kinase)
MSSEARTVPALCPRPTVPLRSRFPGTAEHVARARQWLRTALDGCPVTEDAALLLSELATNALAHSASGRDGAFTVTVLHRSGDVRIEVADQGGLWLPGTAGDELHGRGLAIVSSLARAWGITGDESGRTVWFELDCR